MRRRSMSGQNTSNWNDDAIHNWMERCKDSDSDRPGTSASASSEVTNDQVTEISFSCLDMKYVTMRRGRRRSRSVNASNELPQVQIPEQSVNLSDVGLLRQVQVSNAEVGLGQKYIQKNRTYDIISTIKNEIQDTESRIKDEKAIQNNRHKLNSKVDEFEHKILPALNFIFEKIGMDPLSPVSPEKFQGYLEHLKLVEQSIEEAKQVMMSMSGTESTESQDCSNNNGSKTSELNDSKEHEVTVLTEMIELREFEINELQMSLLQLENEQKTQETEDKGDEEEVEVEERIFSTPAHKKREEFYFE